MPAKQKPARRRKIRALTAAILIFGMLCAMAVGYDYAYSLHISNLPRAEYFVHKPLSGRLWEIDPSNISGIYFYQQPDSSHTSRLDVRDPERIETIVELLNSYRFYFWLPVVDLRAQAFGGRRVDVKVKELHGGSTHPVEDLDFWIREDGLLNYNDIVYFSSRRLYDELEKLREEYNEHPYVPVSQRRTPGAEDSKEPG